MTRNANSILLLLSLVAPLTANAATYCPAVSANVLTEPRIVVQQATEYLAARIAAEGAEKLSFKFLATLESYFRRNRFTRFEALDSELRLAISDLVLIASRSPGLVSDPWKNFLISNGIDVAYAKLEVAGKDTTDARNAIESPLREWLAENETLSEAEASELIRRFQAESTTDAQDALLPQIVGLAVRRPAQFPRAVLQWMLDHPERVRNILEGTTLRALTEAEKSLLVALLTQYIPQR